MHGHCALGPFRIRWLVPDQHAGAAASLPFFPTSSIASERDVAWTVDVGEPGPAPRGHDAFFDRALVRFAPNGTARVWSPTHHLVVTANEVRGVVAPTASDSARDGVAPAIALHVLAGHGPLLHLHAGLVELSGRIIAFLGGSGSGKTSAVLACASAGALAMTDDLVYVDDRTQAWPARRPAHVAPRTLDAHPALRAEGSVEEREKKALVRVVARDERTPRIDALVLASIAPEPTRVEAASVPDAFAGLLGSSAFARVDGAPHRDWSRDRMATLSALPTARLAAGPDALATPGIVPSLLSRWLETV